MTKHRQPILRLCLALLCLMVAAAAYAQTADAPLILWSRGDLYAVSATDAPPERLSNDGTISDPAISPNGSQLIYRTLPPQSQEALARIDPSAPIAEIALPTNIELYNGTARQITSTAVQPEAFSLFVPGVPDAAVIRGAPAWSPDGTRFAWAEYDLPEIGTRIILSDAVGGNFELLRGIGFPTDVPFAPDLIYGEGWLALDVSDDAAGEQRFLFYTVSGERLSESRISVGETAITAVPVRLSDGSVQLGILYERGGWVLIDPQSGAAQAAPAIPVLTTNAPDSLALRFAYSDEAGLFAEVVNGTAAFPAAPDQIALSPDGQALAVIGIPATGAVSIFRDGALTTIPGTGSGDDDVFAGTLLWGRGVWRLPG